MRANFGRAYGQPPRDLRRLHMPSQTREYRSTPCSRSRRRNIASAPLGSGGGGKGSFTARVLLTKLDTKPWLNYPRAQHVAAAGLRRVEIGNPNVIIAVNIDSKARIRTHSLDFNLRRLPPLVICTPSWSISRDIERRRARRFSAIAIVLLPITARDFGLDML